MSSWDPNHLEIGIIAAPTSVYSCISHARVLIRLISFAGIVPFYKPLAVLSAWPRQHSWQARLEEARVYTNTAVGPSRAGFESRKVLEGVTKANDAVSASIENRLFGGVQSLNFRFHYAPILAREGL
jgi:hypothetical protein